MSSLVEFLVQMKDLSRNRRFRRAMRLFDDLRPEMRQVGEWLVRDAEQRLKARDTEYNQYASGRLLRSLNVHPFKKAVTISSVQPYARIQQHGGTVRSKRANGYLAIPIQAREKKNHAWPRHWRTPLRVVRSRAGKLYLFSVRFKQIVYRLISQVTIPGRPYLVKSAAVLEYMRDLVAARIRGANRERGAS